MRVSHKILMDRVNQRLRDHLFGNLSSEFVYVPYIPVQYSKLGLSPQDYKAFVATQSTAQENLGGV
jgi:hypothetical protein